MLREQFDGAAICYGIRLRQVSHRFDQESLAIDVTRVRCSFTPLASYLWSYRDSENLGHKKNVSKFGALLPLLFFSKRLVFGSITSRTRFFSHYLFHKIQQFGPR
jgi:hypothetical protein